MSAALYLAACYLLGAVPTGYLAGRLLRGIDIRTQGSGNMGATNVFRVLGKGPGSAVLAIDIAKGLAAAVLLPGFFGAPEGWDLLGGLAAVLGHNYTVFLGFKGGKGVATSAGVCLGLAPLSTLTAIALFGLAFGIWKTVSIGSLAAATALPLALWYYGETRGGPMLLLGLGLAAFIWVRHIPNLKRLMAGTENSFRKKEGP